ncbi:MAG TPA: hypothetical protein VHD69_00635 [Candidatus Paceibacterota bacterium]|jgi:hypothetical protein|nr:hypothetical protein [Candidatus Paceibacterota bacterium]
MTWELTLMAVSGIGMIALLAHKRSELSKGMPSAHVENVRVKADPVLYDIGRKTARAASQLTFRNIVLVLNHAFVALVRFFMDISHRAHKVSSNIVERASKKTEDLSRGGAASFYLKQIKETKEEAQSAPEPTTRIEGQ